MVVNSRKFLFTRRSLVQGATAATAGAVVATALPRRSYGFQSAVTLTWWDYYQDANEAAVLKQFDAYKVATGVTIERQYFAFADLKQRLLQGATASQLPDVVIIDNPDHQSFAALGVFADISDRLTAWGQTANFFEGPLNSTIWQDKHYGLPDNSNCIVLWTNNDLLTAAGVTAPTNWDELKATAAALSGPGKYGLAMSGVRSEEGTFQFLPFLWETGADLATFDSDGGRAALQLWVDLVADHSMSQGILGWTQGDVCGQFQNGLAAMMVNGPWQIPRLAEESPDLKWSVSTLPAQAQGASVLGGENMALTAASKNLDAAWEFMAWRNDPANLKQYLVDAGKLPSRSDLAEDPTWTADPVLSIFVEQLKVAKPRAYGDKYPEMSAAIQTAMQSTVSGQTDVATAATTAQNAITPLLPAS